MFEGLSINADVLGFGTALGVGLLIGAERERRKGDGPARAPAGIRTHAVVALLGAVAFRLGDVLLTAVLLAGVTTFVALAYRRSVSTDPGITSEAALILTALLGALAMNNAPLAGALGVVLAIILAARTPMHHFVRNVLSESELHDLLVLAAAVLVVMPLVPDRSMGPYDAINPRSIWIIVVLIMAIGAVGYIALKLIGARFGLPLAGFISGFVSSTATIGAMGGLARREPAALRPAVAGAVLSTVATIVQMAAVLAITSPPTLRAMSGALAAAGGVALAYGLVFMWHAVRSDTAEPTPSGRMVNVTAALIFATTVASVQILAAALEAWLGSAGVAVAAAAAGFADTHSAAASVASLVKAGRLETAAAVLPILLALSTNTVSKAVFALLGGGARYGVPIIGGLVLVLAAAWAGALLF